MEWVETTGETLAAAVERALAQLGVGETDAEIVVLQEPRSSMFGLRKVEARIRARVRPVQARAKRPARRPQNGDARRRGQGQRGERPADGAGKEESRAKRPSGRGQEQAGTAPRRSSRGGAKGEGASTGPGAKSAATGQEPAGQGGASRSSRRRRSSAKPASSDSKARPQEEEGSPEEEKMSIESQAELATEFVRGVVDRFGLEAELSSAVDDETVRVDVSGENLGLLIGPRGATVDALQELTRTAVQRRGEDAGVRIVVDVGGYRVRRAAALQQFARRVAAEVAEAGVPQALEPMSASDRKIVHDTVNEMPGVRTTSEGEDPRRYVVIHPSSTAGDGERDDPEPALETEND